MTYNVGQRVTITHPEINAGEPVTGTIYFVRSSRQGAGQYVSLEGDDGRVCGGPFEAHEIAPA